MKWRLGLGLLAIVAVASANVHMNTWAIELDSAGSLSAAQTRTVAEQVARDHGMSVLGGIAGLHGHFSLAPLDHTETIATGLHQKHRRDAELSERIGADGRVAWAEQQRALSRQRRDNAYTHFVDPLFPNQWHIHNTKQVGRDLNVESVWDKGFTGKGVVVCVLDDGIEHDHKDFQESYMAEASFDYNSNDPDPYPRYESTNINKHGTRCAGEIAADPNTVCGVGVAYGAKVGGVRMLDGPVTDTLEANSIGFKQELIDVYSSSWGPDDDGRTVEAPGRLASAAFQRGITRGRAGKGNIFVFASGNGGRYGDNCNCDGYTNSMYTISIGSVTDTEEKPWYAEQCSAQMAVTWSSGGSYSRSISTTDLHHSCTNSHSGTSASAPLASAVFALVLEANAALTWRDMQHLVVRAARRVHASDSWVKNGAGLFFSHTFGYGVIDAELIVAMAQSWKNVGAWHQCVSPVMTANKPLPDGSGEVVLEHDSTGCHSDSGAVVDALEHVQVVVNIAHERRGDLSVVLESPSGMTSTLLTRRSSDSSAAGFVDWTFMSVAHWGENPKGKWKLHVLDQAANGRTGTIRDWTLKLYGTSQDVIVPVHFELSNSSNDDAAKDPALNTAGGTAHKLPSWILMVVGVVTGSVLVVSLVVYYGYRWYTGTSAVPDTMRGFVMRNPLNGRARARGQRYAALDELDFDDDFDDDDDDEVILADMRDNGSRRLAANAGAAQTTTVVVPRSSTASVSRGRYDIDDDEDDDDAI